MGTVNDTGTLGSRLTQVFEERKTTGGFKTGTQEVEKRFSLKLRARSSTATW
jgi:hypothetical protein